MSDPVFGNSAYRTDRVRIMQLLRKKDGVSLDEFHDHWQNAHAKLFSSVPLAKKNLYKYEQGHTDSEALELVKSMGFAVGDYHGSVIFEADSYQKILDVFNSPEYKEHVVPDEAKFFDRENSPVLPIKMIVVINQL